MPNLPSHTGILRTQRMPSSINGNPRFAVIIDGCGVIGTTRPDSSLGYSIQNYDGKRVTVYTHTTPSGRCYVVDVETCQDKALE